MNLLSQGDLTLYIDARTRSKPSMGLSQFPNEPFAPTPAQKLLRFSQSTGPLSLTYAFEFSQSRYETSETFGTGGASAVNSISSVFPPGSIRQSGAATSTYRNWSAPIACLVFGPQSPSASSKLRPGSRPSINQSLSLCCTTITSAERFFPYLPTELLIYTHPLRSVTR